jgi:hypothetical protein
MLDRLPESLLPDSADFSKFLLSSASARLSPDDSDKGWRAFFFFVPFFSVIGAGGGMIVSLSEEESNTNGSNLVPPVVTPLGRMRQALVAAALGVTTLIAATGGNNAADGTVIGAIGPGDTGDLFQGRYDAPTLYVVGKLVGIDNNST